jgi:hypothetical protein
MDTQGLPRRFGFFGFGMLLGLALTFFILNKKNAQCSYFPNARVLNNMKNKPRVYAPEVMQLAATAGLDSNDWNAFFTVGQVDFGRSDTELDSCKTYYIASELARYPQAAIWVNNCDSVVEITRLELR